MTRDELIAAATAIHDQECQSCDRKYRHSCPNFANAILRAGMPEQPAATAEPPDDLHARLPRRRA